MLHTYSGILVSLKREGNPATFDSMEGLVGIMLNGIQILWSHLYKKHKIVKLIKPQSFKSFLNRS